MQIANQIKIQEVRLNMFRFLLRLLCVASLMVVMGGLPLSSQMAMGRFSGTVSDSDGGAIPGASVQIVNQETLVKRDTKTDGAGEYIVPSLPAGRYQIVVDAEGFSRRESAFITLAQGQAFVYNVNMSVGGVQTQIEVTGGAGATTVDADTASISTTLGQQEVTGYGLNGRNFSQLITMAPGASNQT